MFLIIVSMLIWGSVTIFARWTGLPSTLIVFFRVLVASVSLFPIILFKKGFNSLKIQDKKGFVFLISLCLALNWVFLFKAVLITSIANAILSYYTAPVIVVALSPFLLKEKLKLQVLFSLILAVSGVTLIASGNNFSFTSKDFIGVLFGLLAAFFYAFLTILGRYLKEIPEDILTFYQVSISALILLPFFFVNKASYTREGLAAVVTMGLIHTALALSLYFKGLKTVEASTASLLSYLDPLSAIFYAFIFFSEIPPTQTVAGGILIIVASLFLIINRNLKLIS